MADHSFDGKAERFRDKIYGGVKGELRLHQVWRDMCEQIPGLEKGGLQVWDAGGGLGQISARLAEQGHRVLLSDLSADMLSLARETLPPSVAVERSAIQDHAADPVHHGDYDVIVCHAVLEWLGEPRATLQQLLQCLRPGGHLSLMFYNVNALILGNMVKGNYYKLYAEDFTGHPGGLTPPSPQDPQRVQQWLLDGGLQIVQRRSMRFAHDLLNKALRAERSLDDMLQLEWQYGAREPFWQLGRYVHLVARRPD